jgi:hypothetical protein
MNVLMSVQIQHITRRENVKAALITVLLVLIVYLVILVRKTPSCITTPAQNQAAYLNAHQPTTNKMEYVCHVEISVILVSMQITVRSVSVRRMN